jgi:hypothetical protein
MAIEAMAALDLIIPVTDIILSVRSRLPGWCDPRRRGVELTGGYPSRLLPTVAPLESRVSGVARGWKPLMMVDWRAASQSFAAAP